MSKRIEFNGLKLKVDNDERVHFLNFQSSAISALAYNVDDKSLYAIFRSNPKKRYVYVDVPYTVWQKLCEANSIGGHFARRVKAVYNSFDEDNKY